MQQEDAEKGIFWDYVVEKEDKSIKEDDVIQKIISKETRHGIYQT